MIQTIAIAFRVLMSYVVADNIGRQKKMGFIATLLLCLLLKSIVGFLLCDNSGAKEPKGCKWCGNTENEAEYCGLCYKDEDGNLSPKGLRLRKNWS